MKRKGQTPPPASCPPLTAGPPTVSRSHEMWAQMWHDRYHALQLTAIGARARGEHDREREALDLLALMDREQQPPADLTGWTHLDRAVICPRQHYIPCGNDLPSIMAAIAEHECDSAF